MNIEKYKTASNIPVQFLPVALFKHRQVKEIKVKVAEIIYHANCSSYQHVDKLIKRNTLEQL